MNDEMTHSKLISVLSALTLDPWLITPQMHKVLTDIAVAHAAGNEQTDAQHRLAAAMPDNPAQRKFQVEGSTAILPFEGVIGRKFSSSLKSSGVVSIDIATRMLKNIAADDQIDSVMMVFDSPGGVAMGVPECAEAVRECKKAGKSVMAYVDGLCCSAAYWIASQADEIAASPSSLIGSIGAYMAILDQSRAAEMAGLKVEVFKSGPHKGMGMQGTSLTDAQRAMLQERVDQLGAEFKATVRLERDGREGRKISEECMQGQTFSVKECLVNGLIDAQMSSAAAMSALADLKNIRRSNYTGRGRV